MPTSAPRQWIALLVIAIAVVIGATQIPLLRRISTLRPGIAWHPPPDLAGLCVLYANGEREQMCSELHGSVQSGAGLGQAVDEAEL